MDSMTSNNSTEKLEVRYVIAQTKQEQFEDIYDEVQFRKRFEAGEVCEHDIDMGKCRKWCLGNPEAVAERHETD